MQSVYVGSKSQNIRVESTSPSHFAHKRVALTVESSLPKKSSHTQKACKFQHFSKNYFEP
jgi:hypothetical protein